MPEEDEFVPAAPPAVGTTGVFPDAPVYFEVLPLAAATFGLLPFIIDFQM